MDFLSLSGPDMTLYLVCGNGLLFAEVQHIS